MLSPIDANGFWGSHIRSALGRHLRDSCCPFPQQACPACLLRFDCPFATAYFSYPPPGAALPRGVTTAAPHPYVVRVPVDTPRSLLPGQRLEFEIVLFGQAAQRPAVWVVALARLAQHGLRARSFPLRLLEVAQRKGRRSRYLWKEGWEQVLPAWKDGLALLPAPRLRQGPNRLDIAFQAPVRLRHESSEAAGLRPDYALLRAALARRLEGLLWYCTGQRILLEQELEHIPPARVLHQRWEPEALQRWSSAQQRTLNASGWRGSLSLEGVDPRELQLWLAGSLTGIGSLATFGLGWYEAEIVT